MRWALAVLALSAAIGCRRAVPDDDAKLANQQGFAVQWSAPSTPQTQK